jgi:1,2-diacylglycerol 3-beta-galactosyltransferase
MNAPRVLFAWSDTGGGHRSAARAIADAIVAQRPAAQVDGCDVLAEYAGWPFRQMPAWYPRTIDHAAWLWGAGFALTDTARRAALLQRLAWPVVRDGMRRLARERTADVVVNTHPLLATPLRRVLPDVPIVTVVTDLVSGHAWWYDDAADLTIVPTSAARTRALACGVHGTRVAVCGLPVHDAAVAIPGEKPALQRALGWSTTRPTVLLVGGAEGMGPLASLARAIDRAALDCDLAVVAGRNARLEAAWRDEAWRGRTHVYGFVPHFAQLLRAAAAIVTKAGPGTIAESCAAGCPLVLFGAIPGQETGNVTHVTDGNAGVWAPSPEAVVTALAAWLDRRDGPAALRRAAVHALRLARPHAARDIAGHVLALAAQGRRVRSNGGTGAPITVPTAVARTAAA